jgi:hypothetical protein
MPRRPRRRASGHDDPLTEVTAVPEPPIALLLAGGLWTTWLARRRRAPPRA